MTRPAWNPPDGWLRIETVDAHTEGEPLRVIVTGFPQPEGDTVLERRRSARAASDHLRRALMWEPRGHADMYGCLVMPPVTPAADFSVLFMHNEGYSTMCGHGIIGVTKIAVEAGWTGGARAGSAADSGAETGGEGAGTEGGGGAGAEGGGGAGAGQVRAGGAGELAAAEHGATERPVVIDTPAGLVRARAIMAGDRVSEVRFLNVPSFTAGLDKTVEVPDIGSVRYDLAYGGAFYAYVDADQLGLPLTPAGAADLIRAGRQITRAVSASDPNIQHPDEPDLGFLYGTVFTGSAEMAGRHSRHACIFADGELDRSPTGTAVSGRLAILHARHQLTALEEIVVESIIGGRFTGRIAETGSVGGRAAVVPEIGGRAWITGRHEFLLDPTDPWRDGFLLR